MGVTPGGTALLDHQLFLPESWCEDTRAGRDRREKVHIPETVTFQTKPEIAAGLIRRTAALGIVTLDWITADEAYGRTGAFLDEMDGLEQRYKALASMESPYARATRRLRPEYCIQSAAERLGSGECVSPHFG